MGFQGFQYGRVRHRFAFLRRIVMKDNPAVAANHHGVADPLIGFDDIPALFIEPGQVVQFDAELEQPIQLELKAGADGQGAGLQGIPVGLPELITGYADNGYNSRGYDYNGNQRTLGADAEPHYLSQSNLVITSADNSNPLLTLMPSFLARARLITGIPLAVGFMGKLEGLLPSVKIARAFCPASSPCSRSDTVTAQRVP